MGSGKLWTAEDVDYLCDHWGSYGGIPAIARALGRSENAIAMKAYKLGLGPYLASSEYIPFDELLRQLVATRGYSNAVYRFIRLGLPFHMVRIRGSRVRMVSIEEFWKWAKAHRNDISLSRLEPGILGREPEWAKAKRRTDIENDRAGSPWKRPWSADELNLLRAMLDQGATCADLSATLHRTAAAIRRKIYDLYLPKPQRCRTKRWTDAEERELSALRAQGLNCNSIARRMGRSPEAVRGRMAILDARG